ncbi:hypothetical protein [Algiphilus sp.]|uniref:hypothetical protein n=1 Tax=Algiphilus sp. TaxID=1872431 RepID=UPI003B52C81F
MKTVLCGAACFLWSFSAVAGDFRGALAYGIGAVSIEADGGDEVEADSSDLVIDGVYFLGESGPFLGARFSQAEVDDFEFNGESLDLPTLEVDTTSFVAGYRAGARGELQPFGSVRFSRSDSDEGDDDDAITFTVGVERDTGGGRFGVDLDYRNEDDFDSFGLDVTGVIYVTEMLGLGATAGYSLGDGTFLEEDADTSSWVLGAAIELRVFR